MAATLRILCAALGAIALAIAMSMLLQGPEATLSTGKQAYHALSGTASIPGPIWSADMDSELRFYAAIWGSYGVLLLLVAKNLERRLHWIPWLATVFFFGGVGRVISIFSIGPPHPFIIILTVIELAMPLFFWACWARLRISRHRHSPQGHVR
ncbi:MAG TPA: DUF4345 domain-containing protein [Devosia sp.]|jgi:hypothetical protein|uniref:DUF4345 domain-containing protein n=1 Tax=Devosia sp. TaxID=1871048 RepID=UPI002DDD8D24|nr:DUF4345 domain-containing protein [Devosia sp.]HEV2515301.1 DUF4345 domain-containing protein [Devosia sp.]